MQKAMGVPYDDDDMSRVQRQEQILDRQISNRRGEVSCLRHIELGSIICERLVQTFFTVAPSANMNLKPSTSWMK